MGACGCGDYAGRWRIPGPDDSWYVIGLYHGCNNGCNTPLGLSIDLFDAEDMRTWDANRLPIIGGPDHPNFGIPIIDIDSLKIAIFNALDMCGVCVGEDEDERESCMDEFDAQELVSSVAYSTAKQFDADVKRANKRTKKASTPAAEEKSDE